MRTLFVVGSFLLTLTLLGLSSLQPVVALSFVLVGAVLVRGYQDLLQTRQARPPFLLRRRLLQLSPVC